MNARYHATPWFSTVSVAPEDGSQLAHIRCSARPGELPLAIIVGMHAEEDATFIVEACNAHDDLVEALRKAVASLRHLQRRGVEPNEVDAEATRQVIARADEALEKLAA